jgi:acetyl esterase/lipase
MTAAQDIPYLQTDSGPVLARLYRPQSPNGAAVVSVHGGRWVSQDRLTNAVIDEALAAAGVAVMALDFRMPPLVRYPVPVSEINFAIRWLKQHANELGASADRVGAVGTSSGGHQIMLNALRPRDARYAALAGDGGHGAELAFAVACWPVLDPLARYRMAKERKMELHVKSHDAYWPDEAAMAEGNPQLILERGEAVKLPPVLLIQGMADTTVLPEMTARFAATYRARGGEATLETYAAQPHTFITNSPDIPESCAAIKMIEQFVVREGQKIRT